MISCHFTLNCYEALTTYIYLFIYYYYFIYTKIILRTWINNTKYYNLVLAQVCAAISINCSVIAGPVSNTILYKNPSVFCNNT